MNPRRSITFLVSLALVAAMLYPIPLHHCQASAMPAIFQTVSASHDVAERSCCVDRSACGCRHRGGSAPMKSPSQKGLAIDGSVAPTLLPGSDCGCISVPRIPIDAAVLIAPHVLAAPDAAFAPALPGVAHCIAPVSVRISHTGSSPPYLASRDHYTYLRTATLLI